MRQAALILRALVTDGRWRRSLAFAIVFAIGCAGLSWWQFARREETANANAVLTQNWTAAPRPLDDVLPTLTSWRNDVTWRPVRVRGTYLLEDQLLVRNRSNDATPGFEVLTPLRLTDGRVFVVDRGWLSVGTKQDRPDVTPEPQRGIVTVIARLRPNEHALPGRTAPAGELPSIDLDAVAKRVGAATYTGAYGLMMSESPAAATNPAQLAAPTFSSDEGTHLSYAIQWIAFAVIAFGGLAWSVRRDLLEAGDPVIVEAEERAEARRRSRPPRDEDIEDALADR